MPNTNTTFLPFSEIENYSDKDKFFCTGIVFSPETENNHFEGCPPYIEICSSIDYDTTFYFKVPEIIAYHAKVHDGYTMEGMKKRLKEGERNLANEIKSLLMLH